MQEHISVMVEEVLAALPLKPGAIVVDGTIGLAGHSARMIDRIVPGGVLVGIDWDQQMLDIARERLADKANVDVHLFHSDYRAIADALDASVPGKKADAILLDLGLNNAQIEDAQRGISFRTDAPLDMRMDRSSGEPASSWLNRATAREIERVLWEYGDERWARKIAQVVVDRRKIKPLHSTFDLVNVIEAAVPAAKRDKRIHVATRSFQAIRIHVNSELDGLTDCIEDAARCLATGGVIVVLSYHSGEDRATKHAFRALAATQEFEEMNRKPITPTPEEIARNPKSRSAKLRALRRKS